MIATWLRHDERNFSNATGVLRLCPRGLKVTICASTEDPRRFIGASYVYLLEARKTTTSDGYFITLLWWTRGIETK
ncbi:unnamed protein product [Amoebophrya sp. A120]|nr:unnamed protein product [Amoebophrya sp. A120]|eukprot:GSA120T00009783001.1